MNTYTYYIPSVLDDMDWYTMIHIGMTSANKVILDFCIRHNQLRLLPGLYEYLQSIGCDNPSSLREYVQDDTIGYGSSSDIDPDYIFSYEKKIVTNRFNMVLMIDKTPIKHVPVYISTPDILFDILNDQCTLGDLPDDIKEKLDVIVYLLVSEMEDSLHLIPGCMIDIVSYDSILECDSECNPSIGDIHIDYVC